jgi:hypothetical protein
MNTSSCLIARGSSLIRIENELAKGEHFDRDIVRQLSQIRKNPTIDRYFGSLPSKRHTTPAYISSGLMGDHLGFLARENDSLAFDDSRLANTEDRVEERS